jgi:outer membrane protein assembly factor BamB
VLLLGGTCRRSLYPPEIISAPQAVYAGDTAWVRLITRGEGYDRLRYIVDWEDGPLDTTEATYGLYDTAVVWHVWKSPGAMEVHATVFPDDGSRTVGWSAHRNVVVERGGPHAPQIDSVHAPSFAATGIAVNIKVWAHDAEGESILVLVEWGQGQETTASSLLASPCSVRLDHTYLWTQTVDVVVTARDRDGATSLPAVVHLKVGVAGGVRRFWLEEREHISSLVTARQSGYEEMFFIADGGLYSLTRGKQVTSDYLTGNPVFCEATGHILAADEFQGVHAIPVSGGPSWDWVPAESLYAPEWTAAAVRDSHFVVPFYRDSITLGLDSGSLGAREAAFRPGFSPTDAPVIDASGNIVIVAESGRVYKMSPDLDSVLWLVDLHGSRVLSPAIGADGTVYCTADSSRVFALSPDDGSVKPGWPVRLDGEPSGLALGRSALFAGTSRGRACSIDPVTGDVNWQATLDASAGVAATPAVAANGCVYFQDEGDKLWCLDQEDGRVLWVCDCPTYLPRGGARPRRLSARVANPTIASSGDVYLVGNEAIYCVAGYPDGPLDPLALWPKWQHDAYNTGHK